MLVYLLETNEHQYTSIIYQYISSAKFNIFWVKNHWKTKNSIKSHMAHVWIWDVVRPKMYKYLQSRSCLITEGLIQKSNVFTVSRPWNSIQSHQLTWIQIRRQHNTSIYHNYVIDLLQMVFKEKECHIRVAVLAMIVWLFCIVLMVI